MLQDCPKKKKEKKKRQYLWKKEVTNKEATVCSQKVN